MHPDIYVQSTLYITETLNLRLQFWIKTMLDVSSDLGPGAMSQT